MQQIITETNEILLTEREVIELIQKEYGVKLKTISFSTFYTGTKELVIK